MVPQVFFACLLENALKESRLQVSALSVAEGQRALEQCKEQPGLLEKALANVERASQKGEVYPEILFTAAKLWSEVRFLLRVSCIIVDEMKI